VAADGNPEPRLREELADVMARLAAGGGGSSQCVERMLVLTEPPRLDAGEITDKGYVNQVAVRERRTEAVALLARRPAPGEDLPPQVVLRRAAEPAR
jgi:feruloyl-CoA synthase